MAVGLGSLTNTLQGLDPNTLAQALQEEEQRRLAAQTAAATTQAQQAGSQYQQAAGAPAPELGLAEAFIPALLGNIASVIGQNPAYAEQGQQRIQQSRATLLKSRAENLQALRDVWGQKAEAAKSAGDIEAEMTARTKHEQIAKVYQQVADTAEHASRSELQKQAQEGAFKLEQERQRGDIAAIGARGAQDRATQTQGATLVKSSERSALTRGGIDPDTGLTLKTFALRELSRGEALAKNRDPNSRNEAYNSMWRTATDRWSSDKTPIDMGNRLLRMRHPFYQGNPKEARYFLTDEKIFRKGRDGKWVTDSDAELRAKARAREIVMPYFEGS